MVPEQTIPRYVAMLAMFSKHYAERLSGNAYPTRIDTIPALLTTYEKQTLYRLAQRVPAGGVIVEIGSFKGGSTACFGAGTQASHAQIHCIDTFRAENVQGSEGQDTLAEFQKNVAPYMSRITIHRGWSHEVHESVPTPIDCLFVDGDHSYEGVSRDLRLYLPKLRDNAILILHDSAYPPVQRAIREFVLPRETKRLARLPNMYAGQVAAR